MRDNEGEAGVTRQQRLLTALTRLLATQVLGAKGAPDEEDPWSPRCAVQVHPGSEESLVIDGDLTIDLGRNRVILRGIECALTATEHRLLFQLVSNVGRLMPFETLLTRVWGSEYHEEVHYVRLYVSYLRAKIEPDPAHPRYILTEKGLGYRFAAGQEHECAPRRPGQEHAGLNPQEFQTLVAVIAAYATALLLRTARDEDSAEARILSCIEEQTRLLLGLIDELVGLQRPQSTPLTVGERRFDLAELAARVAEVIEAASFVSS